MKFLTFAIAGLFSAQALACFSPGPEQQDDWTKLVQRSKDIVLVQVMSAKAAAEPHNPSQQGETVYQFKVLETLKGKAKKGTMEWQGRTGPQDPGRAEVSHKSKDFYSNGSVGMTSIGPDCILVPNIEVGSQYLIFLTKPYHFKSFEKITSKDDQWLKKVRAEAKKPYKKIM
jgi:hypothetical protein